MTRFFIFLLLTASFTISYAGKQRTVGVNGEMINEINHLDVFLIKGVKNISKTDKQSAEFKVLNYGIHNCILKGQMWQENTKVFQALLIETQYLKCGEKKYPVTFYSRIISDSRLSLDSKSDFGSFAEPGLEVFFVKN